MIKSILDIGSNSVRLMVVANGIVIMRQKITSQLGKDMVDGYLASDSIIRSVKAVATLCSKAESLGTDKKDIYAFATAAVRNSKNSQDFLTLANAYLINPIDVLSGDTEGEIALLGVLNNLDGAVLDVGGLSSELTVKRDAKIVYSYSLKLGAVGIYDACKNDKNAIEKLVSEKVKEYDNPPIDRLFAVGGTVTSIAHMLVGGDYLREKIHLYEITTQNLEKLIEKIFTMQPEDIERVYNISASRSKIIGGGAILIYSILKKLGLSSLTVSENDNLEGYYRKLEQGDIK